MTGIIKLKNGDKVLVNLDLKDFKKAQEDGNVPGGWKDDMKQVPYFFMYYTQFFCPY